MKIKYDKINAPYSELGFSKDVITTLTVASNLVIS